MPTVIAIAGPNGVGKTTVARSFLEDFLGVTMYVNADTIARGLSEFQPHLAAVSAGRQMLARLEDLATSGQDFAFETTLAGRAYERRIVGWKKRGYTFLLGYLWLPDPSFAVDRVATRVLAGGHAIPEDTIRRRYRAGMINFLETYRRLSDSWGLYDNSGDLPRLIAQGAGERVIAIAQEDLWRTFLAAASR